MGSQRVPEERAALRSSEDSQTFEHEKWLAEKEMHEREIKLKIREQDRLDRELDHKVTETTRSRFTQPLVLAVWRPRPRRRGTYGFGG